MTLEGPQLLFSNLGRTCEHQLLSVMIFEPQVFPWKPEIGKQSKSVYITVNFDSNTL